LRLHFGEKEGMSSLVNVAIHTSQFPEKVRQDLRESLRTRLVNHKFHYDSVKQTQKWLALHQAYSPSRNDADVAAIYNQSFEAATRIKAKKIHIIGLGCGGGQKDTRLARLLAERGRAKSKVQGPKSKVDGADEPTGEAAPDIGSGAETLDFGLWTLDSPIDQIVATEEITELRRKLTRLGSVSLDSLQELAELEMRADTLETQYADLSSAKRSLEEIIATINQDSRRLFTETFASIRTHFQELFRKLFGGGQADILLEDENDILETGIEIIARPPGKELRSISLMSGGEKTLTAVALLLAIFRSKPSPFCILDEVDAALDEANIGRFTTVLRDFLDQSQFIIITHSKKTMAVADVLYGVTMQESGISKRVAVRFEDWVEENGKPQDTPEQVVA
jgi:chromosome segregation ATPase